MNESPQADQPNVINQNETVEKAEKTEKKPRKKGKKVALVLLFVLALVILCGGFYYLLNEKNKSLSANDAEITALRNQIASLSAAAENADETEPTESTSPDLPVIVFEPGGLFDDAAKSEITAKLINPLVDYETENDNQPVSIHVAHSVVNSNDPDYSVFVVYDDDVYSAFLYGDNTKTQQPWFQPICMDTCEFSDAYTAKYPEVVAGVTP